MLLIAFPLTLLAIIAGMMLHAQTIKENLGNMYKYISMFVVIMGFVGLLGVALHGAMRCCHRGQHSMMMKECRMMGNDGGCMMEEHMGYGMMGHHRGMMGGCNMMNGGGCEEMMGNCGQGGSSCHEGMGECKQGMGSGCMEGMGGCSDGKEGTCPMMKGDMHGGMDKKDSLKKK